MTHAPSSDPVILYRPLLWALHRPPALPNLAKNLASNPNARDPARPRPAVLRHTLRLLPSYLELLDFWTPGVAPMA